jgi:peptidoglycan/xylan/chitin deacetylase (PgdA/CDA1 family)
MKKILFFLMGGIILMPGSCASETKSVKKKVVKPVKPVPVVVETKIEHDKIAGLFTFPGGKLKALVMSFDDGPDQDKRLIEMFNKYGIKGTFHLNSGKFAAKSKTSLEQLKIVYAGHEVSAHSVSHPHLEFLPASKVSNEILDDRKKLEAVFGYPIHGMSYPFGTYNQLVLDMLPSLGIKYSRTVTMDTSFHLPKNLLVWNPTCHSGSGEYWAKKFIETKRDEMMLLFIWGHAWEFDNAATDAAKEKNWAVIDNICALLAKETGIWPATAMEVADYITAAQDVVTKSPDGMLVNSSDITLWVKSKDKGVKLKPGQKLAIPK